MAKPKNARAIINAAKLRESTLRLCFEGVLSAEHEELEAELERLTAHGGWTAASLADTDPSVEVSEKLRAVEAEMADHVVSFRFRALKRSDWEAILDAHPGREGKDERFDFSTFVPALVSACLVDPLMDLGEVNELLDVSNEGQRDALFGAAFAVNQEATSVPFSERASAVTRWRAQNSKSLEDGPALPPASF